MGNYGSIIEIRFCWVKITEGEDKKNKTEKKNLLNEKKQSKLKKKKAIDLDCNIINLSLGTSVDSELLHKTIRDAYDAGFKTSNESDNLLIEKTRLLLKTDILSGIDESSANARYYKVLGFAMHLLGDVYAHRTMVPKYTVTGTNSSTYKNSTSVSSADAKFGTSDFKSQSTHAVETDNTLKTWAKESKKYETTICNRWKCFKRAVELGRIEFRDIKYFCSVGNTLGKYEDNINFCTERYADAKFMCEVMFEFSYYKEKYDGIFIFYPTEKNVKLNDLIGCAKNTGEDTSYFTTAEWNEISTMSWY